MRRSGRSAGAGSDPMGYTHAQAQRVLLMDPAPGTEEALLHVLSCGSCGAKLRAGLRRGKESLSEEPDYSGLLGPEIREALERAQGARALLSEVMEAPPEARAAFLDHRHESEEFLEQVLETGRRELNPGKALQLAEMALSLLGRVGGDVEVGDEEVLEWRSEAEVTRGNALRRLGRLTEAKESFDRASDWLSLVPWRFGGGELSRWEGVLWWELGHVDRAEALLRYSLRWYGEGGAPDEEAVTQALLGLLLSEEGGERRSLRLLEAARASLRGEEWPWLSLQVRCCLAAESRLGREGQRGWLKGMSAAEEALRKDPRAQWLEGRALVGMGSAEEGERVLDAARVQLVSLGNLPHAALCTLDLALLLAGKGREVEGLVRDFELLGDSAASIVGLLRLNAVQEQPLPRSYSIDLMRRLRISLRKQGHRVLLPL